VYLSQKYKLLLFVLSAPSDNKAMLSVLSDNKNDGCYQVSRSRISQPTMGEMAALPAIDEKDGLMKSLIGLPYIYLKAEFIKSRAEMYKVIFFDANWLLIIPEIR
jgi:hypothetical protein